MKAVRGGGSYEGYNSFYSLVGGEMLRVKLVII